MDKIQNMRYQIRDISKQILLLLLLALAWSGAQAQVTGNQYTTAYSGTTVTNVSITHKSPKWTALHKGLTADTYNEADMVTLENGAMVQAANAYVDTIYMHKGTSITLTLPYRVSDSNASIYNYYRWFDYRTDGNYYCGSGNGINDLLTPDPAISGTVYRFANGYVVQGATGETAMTKMEFYYPTDTEFSSISSGNFIKTDNDYYVVACDASIYTDFANNDGTTATFGSANSWCEPTLAGRAIFYIVGVEDDTANRPEAFKHYWSLLKDEYQGGGNEIGANGDYVKLYLDEYEITYPAHRLSNNVAEMIALNKDAQAYAIPNATSTDDPGTVNVTLIADATLGFDLVKVVSGEGNTIDEGIANSSVTKSGTATTLSGSERTIFFVKGDIGILYSTTAQQAVPTDTQWNVPDGSTATILVTKTVNGTTYNLARYKLTFKDEATPLTQTQVAGLDNLTGDEGYWWKDMTHRSPNYMKANYTQVASLLFDYDTSINAENILPESNAGQSCFYPFPMDWNTSGYAFFDGATADTNTKYDTCGNIQVGTRFSMYSITNEYIGWWDALHEADVPYPPDGVGKDPDAVGGYWLYIDASERPGAVAELEFDGNLCPGSKLFGTAWIKGVGGVNKNDISVDAGVLFSIGGVKINEDGTETHLPILRQATGQVRATRFISDPVNEPGLSSSITGKGDDTNEWFQIYFSFVNDGSNQFDYYTLRVDNYCAGTNGGDYDFDEVKIYVLTPSIEMAELEPLCTSGDDRSLIRLDLDYETMMSRLGYEPSDYTNETDTETASTASVDFVIINKAKYYNTINASSTDKQKEDAFKAALVTFWGTSESVGENPGHQFPTLDFYLNYNLNTEYDNDDPGSNIVDFHNTDEAFFFRRLSSSDLQELSMDCFTDMEAYTEYIILLEPHTGENRTEEEKLDEFIDLLTDDCAIKTEFYMTASTILKINGEVADPEAEYCAGQELVISPEVSYTDDDGNQIFLENIYFDWFFGDRDEYVAENPEFGGVDGEGGVSLYEALLAFRTYYPDAESLTGVSPIVNFTQDHYDIIAYYLNQTREGSTTKKLVLHMTHLDVRVLSTGVELIIQPIEVKVYDDEGNEIEDICFGYVPLTLMSSGDAPTLRAGFHNIDYPEDYEPCLRLGLAQMEECDETTQFVVNLCDATYTVVDDTDMDHLGVNDEFDYLYLVDTDDPDYLELIRDPGFSQYDLPVGKIAYLYATEDNRTDPNSSIEGSHMLIYFFGEDGSENDGDDDDDGDKVTPVQFTVKEGYYYVLNVHFEEEDADGGKIGAACQGIFSLEVKIVPEYLVWQGEKSANWNNDNHWRRADRTDLNKPESDPYITNAENGTSNGFVPMLFSKVVIPTNTVAELYMSGFVDDTTGMLSWEGDENTPNHDDVAEYPTSNIMYDLMLYETKTTDTSGNTTSSFKTEHYRVNLCDQIHLAPGAQLLHSELLIYDKAWTEVEIPQAKWMLEATPLQGVVSGDWYTKTTSGTETAEYFTDIEFNSSDNNRLAPPIYQRSWSLLGNIIYSPVEGQEENDKTITKTVPAYASTGWSSAYDDATVIYQPGEGFSMKGGYDNQTTNLMFRFPKADTDYTYSNGTTTETIDRATAGKLLISDLVDRTDPDGDGGFTTDSVPSVYKTTPVSVNLTQTSNNYYIVGNPYTAPMSMAAFMNGNSNITGYWTESTYGPIAGNGTYSSWGTDDCLIEPYSAFFVSINDATATPTITFTKDMQTETAVSPARIVAFAIRAENEIGMTGASLAYSETASDGYDANEDAVLMEDVTWQRDGMPLVYTVAGDMAVSVNKLNSMNVIPLGVFADDDSEYTLSFVGVNNLVEPALYDADDESETPLTEGFSLEMEGPSHGRYFIITKGSATTDLAEVLSETYDMTAYSPVQHTVVVSSNAEIGSVEIYSVSGILMKKADVGGNLACTIDNVDSGIAIVRAQTSEGVFVKKIIVR